MEAEPRVVVHAGEAPRTGAPRRLTLAALIALCCWEAIAGRPGLSLVLLVALGPALLVLSGHGRSGRVPVGRVSCALAPLLGIVGLAGAFPALAGQARSGSERALRGALGYWWLTLAGPLLASRLWLPAARRHARDGDVGGIGRPGGHPRRRPRTQPGGAARGAAVGRRRAGAAVDRPRP